MKTTKIQKTVQSSLAALVALLLFFSAGLRLPLLDNSTDDYFREAITKAGVAYATCRVVNASVSIVKDSSLSLEPAGVGVSLAVGQVLDPIDDMVERASDVLVTAITSLGVQKLAFEIGVSLAPKILAMFLFIFSVLIWFENEKVVAVQKTMVKVMVLILIARFAFPLSALANNYIQEHFFAEKIVNANKELAVEVAELDKLTEFSLPEVDGVLGTIKNNASFIQHKSMEFKDAIVATISNAGSIVENLLKLAFLYVGVFIIQVIALPIMVFWLLMKFSNSLFDTNAPVVLHHSRDPGN
jgi:hypothetical protein